MLRHGWNSACAELRNAVQTVAAFFCDLSAFHQSGRRQQGQAFREESRATLGGSLGQAKLERRPGRASTACPDVPHSWSLSHSGFWPLKQTLSLAWVSPALPSGCCCCLTIIWFLGPAETPWQGLAQDHLAECPSLHLFSHFKVMETEAQIEKRTHPQSHGE